MGFFGDLWGGVKSVAGGVAGGVSDIVHGKNPFAGSGSGPGGNYKSWDEVPWWERTVMNIGSGVEGVGKKLMGVVGLDDYAPSSFTDEKDKMKSDIAQKGSSSGWDWGVFGGGSQVGKIYDKFVNDHPDLKDSAGSSLEMGAGVSGGGEQSGGSQFGDNLPGRLGMQMGGNSLGKALALEEDPALKDENYNKNNFNF